MLSNFFFIFFCRKQDFTFSTTLCTLNITYEDFQFASLWAKISSSERKVHSCQLLFPQDSWIMMWNTCVLLVASQGILNSQRNIHPWLNFLNYQNEKQETVVFWLSKSVFIFLEQRENNESIIWICVIYIRALGKT